MKHVVSGNWLAGAIALVIGSGWVCLFGDDMYEALASGLIFPDLLMMVLVALPGIFVIIYGLSQYIYYEETTVHQNSISWKRRGLSGNRKWREPISNYQGELKAHQYRNGSQGDASHRSSHMEYFIRLAHADSGKEVVLYSAESSILALPDDWIEKWRHYAELFKLPVLEKTESGVRSSDVGDLKEPLINKIRDGKIQVIDLNPLEAGLGIMAQIDAR